jgi:hypothetical protein
MGFGDPDAISDVQPGVGAANSDLGLEAQVSGVLSR